MTLTNKRGGCRLFVQTQVFFGLKTKCSSSTKVQKFCRGAHPISYWQELLFRCPVTHSQVKLPQQSVRNPRLELNASTLGEEASNPLTPFTLLPHPGPPPSSVLPHPRPQLNWHEGRPLQNLPPHTLPAIGGQKSFTRTEVIGNHGNLATSVNLNNTLSYQGATFSKSIRSSGSPIWYPPPPPPPLHGFTQGAQLSTSTPYLNHYPTSPHS